MKVKIPLPIYIPDTRGVKLSRYGLGNLKLGPNIYSYSRLPGRPTKPPLGSRDGRLAGTCVNSTRACEKICYAARVVEENAIVAEIWIINSETDDIPPIPKECKLLRLHVSGDFNSVDYINNWTELLKERPDVQCFAYTRSWQDLELRAYLEILRRLPNIQLFASMDEDIKENPPKGWRVAWLSQDKRIHINSNKSLIARHLLTDKPILICPEELGTKPDCESCTYCFRNFKNDVVFIEH